MKLPKHPLGGQPGREKIETDITVIAVYGDRAIVEDSGKRETWVKHNNRPSGYALRIDGAYYEFATSAVPQLA